MMVDGDNNVVINNTVYNIVHNSLWVGDGTTIVCILMYIYIGIGGHRHN